MDGLFSRLRDWEEGGALPFHMPGHKRNTARFPHLAALGAGFDVTEIPGFDDLHAPEEILREGQARCAALYGSLAAFFCVNGSTGGILAGIRAATRRGDRVLVARNCHKAVYHALELCDLRPVFVQPPLLSLFGCAASLPPDAVEKALQEYPDIRLVILTSPTYEGILSDVAAICRLAHARAIPVLVDEAHGAHLGLSPDFPASALQAGADVVVQSLHKTLPSLTQTALVHLPSTRISREELQRQLGIFQTSSPSYLLLASMDACVRLLEEEGDALFSAWSKRLRHVRQRLAPLCHLRLLGEGAGLFALDPGKLVIGTAGSGLSGVSLASCLRERYQIQVELASEHYVIAMTGMGDTDGMLDAFAEALLEVDASCVGTDMPELPTQLPLPLCRFGMADTLSQPWEVRPAEVCVDAVSAAAIWVYPPGIPLVLPGEVLSASLVEQLAHLRTIGLRVLSTYGDLAQGFAVLSTGTE